MPPDTTSSYDDNYLAKFTADEVGADIETHGHVAVTPENRTQNPFTVKGAVAIALDDALEEPDETIKGYHDNKALHTPDLPHQKELSEMSGEIEGVEEGTKMGEDKAVAVKDSLAEALDAIVEDAGPTPDEVPDEGTEEIDGKPVSAITGKPNDDKAPDIPESMGGTDKTDENGLVYITKVFTVDPEKYISNNYRPKAQTPKVATAKDVAKQAKSGQMTDYGDAQKSAQQPDEPTAEQEKAAAKEADKVDISVTEEVTEKETKDEAVEAVVLDYAEFIDGSSFMCFDEISSIDYTKIAMDAGPKKKVTRETCETTFAQCRAKNPLFCRFHGPKLLEADIKKTLKTLVGGGCVVSVTKDKESKNPFTFRLTVGCAPHMKETVEYAIHRFMTNNPGISSAEEWHSVGKNKQTQEFDMDLLRADNPPDFKKVDNKETQAIANVKRMKAQNKNMDVVGETAPALEKKAQQKLPPEQSPAPDVGKEWSQLLHDINHSTLLNSNEFVKAYKGDAQEYDIAYDNKDAEGMKNALESLKGHMAEFEKKMSGDEPETTEETGTVEEKKVGTEETPKEEKEPVEQKQTEKKEEEIEEIEPFGLMSVNEPPKNNTTGSHSTLPLKKNNPYSYEAYGDIPNEDPNTNELEPGGTGDVLGAELLRYASEHDGILNLPKNWGQYSAAMARWQRANKTGGLYHGKPATKLNKPTMSAFGIVDPMADWIDNTLNGGLRQKDRGTFIALFGRSPREGGNDNIGDDAPHEVQAFLEANGPEALADEFLKARDKYAKWSKTARESARKRKEAGNKKRFDDDDIISIDEIEARDSADKAYNEAFAEVSRYDNGTPEIENFSQEKMKGLKEGDTIRFDHSDTEFEVNGYDAENDILTVHPIVGFEEETEKYHITPDGIERIFEEEETETQPTEGEVTNEPKDEDGTAETGVGNEESQTGEEGHGETAEQGSEAVTKPEDAQVETAAEAISANVSVPTEEIKSGLQDRIDGTKEIEPEVKSLVENTLPKGDPVRDAIEKKAESGADNLSLESVTPEQLQKEEKRNRERAEIARLLSAPLKGGGVEQNQSLFDFGGEKGEDLFNRISDTATQAYEKNPSDEVIDAANRTREALQDMRRHENTASELDDFLSEMEKDFDGGYGALVEEAVEGAIVDEDEKAEEAAERAEDGWSELTRLNEDATRKAEKVDKGKSAAKVEKSLTDLAKAVFKRDSKTDSISDEAESIAESVAEYAKGKGVDYELDAPVRDVIDDIKKDEARLNEIMSDFRGAMDTEGEELQGKDISGLTREIGSIAAGIATKFTLLRSMDAVEKRRIDDKVEVNRQKAELLNNGESGNKATEEPKGTEKAQEAKGDVRSQIADIYADWVEEEVPDWVNNITDEEAKEYVGLLEEARDHGSEEGSSALEKLEEFEKNHKNAKTKKTEAKAESKKEKSEATKQNADELRKAAIQASRRLGVEAYKPDDVLEKMLETAKAHISDPRQAQRVKDIEAILADRKAKGKKEVSQSEINSSRAERRFKDRTSDAGILPSEAFKHMKRDYSEGVGNQENDDWEPSKAEIKAEDEMPKKSCAKNAEIVAQMIVQALEGDK